MSWWEVIHWRAGVWHSSTEMEKNVLWFTTFQKHKFTLRWSFSNFLKVPHKNRNISATEAKARNQHLIPSNWENYIGFGKALVRTHCSKFTGAVTACRWQGEFQLNAKALDRQVRYMSPTWLRDWSCQSTWRVMLQFKRPTAITSFDPVTEKTMKYFETSCLP